MGLTSRPSKVKRCIEEFGYDAAVDYRGADLSRELERATPDGIDVFFDNTGGAIADTVFARLNRGAQVVQCGTAATASWTQPPQGPRREREVLLRELRWSGFILMNHLHRAPMAIAELKQMLARGQLRCREHVLEGIEAAPGAIALLYSGDTLGRLSIRL